MGDEEDEVSWIGILNSRIRDQYVNWIQNIFLKSRFSPTLRFSKSDLQEQYQPVFVIDPINIYFDVLRI